ncbi:hypothetical protein PPL_08324 [Heterostelium album PN500]|uniref:Uncharacterized protein n=1 Tax=Heterostelium pallidum (strain ATCC 26659 / Pp 5 / PN500) TaxID=670386 RepID=D3BHV6_HETP5|nr:hypothetical protein PPL_08324 [Heterostelium album PN500]EFA78856.1 hypothetical protein PPL_08324 [Heterostelium album PN500]|eukprot:XP_020430980.1 hypothetical protein PPL_08324 [Heterostelium album PN500]
MEPMSADYNDNCAIQQNTIQKNLDVLLKGIDCWLTNPYNQSLKDIDLRSFNISDFGCSHGRSSLLPISVIITQIRKRMSAVDITVYHNDLPQNDFSQLFLEVNSNPDSYLKVSNNIFTMAAGRSFYDNVFPSNSIHFSIGFNCFHWASKLTSPFKNTIYYGHTQDDNLKKLWKKETVLDLITILSARARELAVGGVFVSNFLTDDNNGFEKSRMFYHKVKKIWDSLATDNYISVEEADKMVYPFRYYGMDDIQTALASPKVSEHGLQMVFSELRSTACPFEPLIKSHGDKYFAEKLFRGFCAFTEPTWKAIIKKNSEAVWQEYYRRFIQYFTENPSHGNIPHNYYIVVMEKTLVNSSDHQGSASC